jgi:hypothetical protein
VSEFTFKKYFELEEAKLSREERLQKQTKNFGLELELACMKNPRHMKDEFEATFPDLAFIDESRRYGSANLLNDMGNVIGISRAYIVSSDASASLEVMKDSTYTMDGQKLEENVGKAVYTWINDVVPKVLQNFMDAFYKNPIHLLKIVQEKLSIEKIAAIYLKYVIEYDEIHEEEKQEELIEYFHELVPQDVLDTFLNFLQTMNFFKYNKIDKEEYYKILQAHGLNDEDKRIIASHSSQFGVEIYDAIKEHLKVKDSTVFADPVISTNEVGVQTNRIKIYDYFEFNKMIEYVSHVYTKGGHIPSLYGGPKYDYGLEIKSPRLAFNDDNIDHISDVFYQMAQSPHVLAHPVAGLHAHIGMLPETTLIHILRIAKYVSDHADEYKEVSGREYNHFAKDMKGIHQNFEELMSKLKNYDIKTMSKELSNLLDLVLNRDDSYILYSLNLVALGGRTIEFRLGSSEIVLKPERFKLFMRFIKDAINYGFEKDYYEFCQTIHGFPVSCPEKGIKRDGLHFRLYIHKGKPPHQRKKKNDPKGETEIIGAHSIWELEIYDADKKRTVRSRFPTHEDLDQPKERTKENIFAYPDLNVVIRQARFVRRRLRNMRTSELNVLKNTLYNKWKNNQTSIEDLVKNARPRAVVKEFYDDFIEWLRLKKGKIQKDQGKYLKRKKPDPALFLAWMHAMYKKKGLIDYLDIHELWRGLEHIKGNDYVFKEKRLNKAIQKLS